MIYPNEAPRNYHFHAIRDMDFDRAPDIRSMTGGVRFQWGFGKDFPITGYAVSVFDENDSAGRWRVFVESSELGIFEDHDDDNWANYLEVKFELDQAVLTTDCYNWEITGDELRIYYKIGAGDFVLIYTSPGPISISGIDYDARDNCLDALTINHLGEEYAAIDVQPHLPDYGPSEIYRIWGPAIARWEYFESGWQRPTVDVDQSFNVPGIECDCSTPAPLIETDDPPTVYEVSYQGEMLLELVRNFLGQYICYCDPENPGVGTPTISHDYRMDLEYKELVNGGKSYAYDAGLLVSTRRACERCSDPIGDPEWQERPYTCITPITLTDPHTYIAWSKTIKHLEAYKHFSFLIQNGQCPITDPENPNPPVPEPCAPSGEDMCWYQANLSFTHDKPPCDAATSVHMWRDMSGRLYAVLSGGSRIQVWRHRVNAPGDVQDVAEGGSGRFAQGAWHPSGRHHIVYRGSDGLKEIVSRGNCVEGLWSEPVDIGDYTHFGFAIDPLSGIEYLIVHEPDDDTWKALRKKPSESSFTIVGEVVDGVATGYMAGLELDPTSKHRQVAVLRGATSLQRFFSLNQGETWRD